MMRRLHLFITAGVLVLEYGAEAGLKLYPFEHGGVRFGVRYSKLRSDVDGLPDTDGLGLGVALLLKH